MTRIVLDPEQLAGTASDLSGAAGEYEAIGARVAACECGCMPAPVAATVDAVTAEVRRRLGNLAGGLAEDGDELVRRSGVDQTGGGPQLVITSDAGAAGTTSIVGGDPYGWFSQPATGGYSLVIGGDSGGWFSPSGSSGSTLVIGGDTTFSQPTATGYSLVISGEPLYRPGEQEAMRAAEERFMPLSTFFPRGVGVNLNPPFMPNLVNLGDIDFYNPMIDPRGGTSSYYDTILHERVFFT